MTKAPPPPDDVELRRAVAIALIGATRSLRTFSDHVAGDHGTTLGQWKTLACLVAHPGSSQVELAEALEIQPISLVRLLDRMAAQGLVERRAHPTDRRAKLVFVTEAGRALHATMIPVGHDIVRRVTDGLDADAVRRLLDMLTLINTNARRGLDRRLGRVKPTEAADAL